MSFDEFQDLYGEDIFYSALGLDTEAFYAAHRAAGGLTSVYRQLGVASERLLQEIFVHALRMNRYDLRWSYEYSQPNGKVGRHTLDAKVVLEDIGDSRAMARVSSWIESAQRSLDVSSTELGGIAFEIRQGYKSADSKRQNADLRFGMRAYQSKLLPAFAIMSSQVSVPVVQRYRNDGMLVLVGTNHPDPTHSTFSFFSDVVGFDLHAFLLRNRDALRREVSLVAETLLSAAE